MTLKHLRKIKCGQESTLKKSGDFIKQTVYVNGEAIYSGDYSKANWDKYLEENLDNANYFEIGRSTYGSAGNWCYSGLKAYCLRLYGKALDEVKVKKNYNETKNFHDNLPETGIQ